MKGKHVAVLGAGVIGLMAVAIAKGAGAKSILDLPATLERLETLGVSVLGYRTEEFPGFFTSRTGLAVPAVAESAAGKRAGDRFQAQVKKAETDTLKERQELERLRGDIEKKLEAAEARWLEASEALEAAETGPTDQDNRKAS